MEKPSTQRTKIGRRTVLKLAAGAGLASAGGIALTPRPAAADTTLAIWTGFPELQPFYEAVAKAYSSAHPEVKCTVFSTSLREAEQKLTAAVPTGTGPDIYDIGTNISINFIESGLIDPNPADVDKYLKTPGAWNKFVVDFFTINGKTYGLPLMEGSKASMFYNKAMFKEAGIAGPPTTMDECVEAAKKLVKFDSSGKMIRSGLSLRLLVKDRAITEKF